MLGNGESEELLAASVGDVLPEQVVKSVLRRRQHNMVTIRRNHIGNLNMYLSNKGEKKTSMVVTTQPGT